MDSYLTHDIVEIYLDDNGEHRWRYKDFGNHKNMANGGEGYKNFTDCLAAVYRVTGVSVDDFPQHVANVVAASGPGTVWSMPRLSGSLTFERDDLG